MNESLSIELSESSIAKQIGERLSSPILGTYAIYWCLVNYKFLMILFSENSIKKTLLLLEEICFPHWWSFIFVYGFPLFFTSAYILGYPYVHRWALVYAQNRKTETEESLITARKAVSLEAHQVEKMQSDYEMRINKLKGEILELTNINVNLRQQLANNRYTPSQDLPKNHRENEIKSLYIDILRFVKGNQGEASYGQISKVTYLDNSLLQRHLNDMIRDELIEMSSSVGQMIYRITPKGKILINQS